MNKFVIGACAAFLSLPLPSFAEGATLLLGFRIKWEGRSDLLAIPMKSLEQCEVEGAKVMEVMASEQLSQHIYDQRHFLCINSQ